MILTRRFFNISHKTEQFEKFLKEKIKSFHLNYCYIKGSTALVTKLTFRGIKNLEVTDF